jgi:H+/Cl- antiporter ClcA
MSNILNNSYTITTLSIFTILLVLMCFMNNSEEKTRINYVDIAGIILLVCFIAIFLAIFFFTYTTTIENHIVVNQVEYLIKDFKNDIKGIPEPYMSEINNQLQNITEPDFEELKEADKKVLDNNKKVINDSIKYIGIFSIIVVIIVIYLLYLNKKNNPNSNIGNDLYHIVKENSIILIFIAITEFIFLMCFGRNFRSVDPNFVKHTVLNKLSKIQ